MTARQNLDNDLTLCNVSLNKYWEKVSILRKTLFYCWKMSEMAKQTCIFCCKRFTLLKPDLTLLLKMVTMTEGSHIWVLNGFDPDIQIHPSISYRKLDFSLSSNSINPNATQCGFEMLKWTHPKRPWKQRRKQWLHCRKDESPTKHKQFSIDKLCPVHQSFTVDTKKRDLTVRKNEMKMFCEWTGILFLSQYLLF